MNELNEWMRKAETNRVGFRVAFLEAVNLGASPRRAVQMAEQAAAEAWTHAGQAVVKGRIASEAHFRSYARRAAVHRVRDEIRRCRRLQQLDEQSPLVDPGRPETREEEDRKVVIQEALQQLDQSERVLIHLYYFEGRTYQQLADIHGVSVATMFRRLGCIRARIGQALVGRGMSL
jgi:RNA polymerase sigma factor (sigma-70 family)